MRRSMVAALLGAAMVVVWVAGAATLSDRLGGLPVWGQLIYFAVAGVGWVVPAWWLMRWGVRG